jgi:hypothetical protein
MMGSTLSLLLILNGCATMQLPEYKTQSLKPYMLSYVEDGLSVAIHPLIKREESEQYFGLDLLAVNVLAVHVVAENRNSLVSFVLSKNQVSLHTEGVLADQNPQRDQLVSESGGQSLTMAGAAVAGAGVIFTPLLIAALPLVFAGAKQFSDADVIKHNFAVKELQTNTLSPGESAEGFVYFRLPKEMDAQDQWRLRLQALNLQSKEMTSFDFPLDLSDLQRRHNENAKSQN